MIARNIVQPLVRSQNMKAVRQNAQRWQAVLERDPRYDERFVYAVKTTGIYCKASCGARRPRKENVLFFDSIEAAERAGYRECAKCRLRSGPDDLLAVHVALDFLDSHLDERVTLATLARQVALSPFHFQRLFKRRVGVSPRIYLATRRAERLKTQLRSARNVAEASFGAGYTDERLAYTDARRALGMTPGQYRKHGAGKLIAYIVMQTPIGKALVAATSRGIAAIYFGANARQLEADLRAEYPAATIARSSPRLSTDLKTQLASGRETVLRQLRGGESLAPGLDIDGTPFQSKVWDALKRIPSGQTRSYRDVAKLIGKPGAARAVARACAANKVALVIPCHRVVRSDGELAKYRWGAQRKRALLALEKIAS